MSELALCMTADAVEVGFGGTTLLRYLFRPDLARTDSPRPYAHPVRTLAGDEITAVGPEDHPWHLGISMAVADVDGDNFWGGPTYVDGSGYRYREDHGEVRHRRWADVSVSADSCELTEELSWLAADGRVVLAEARVLRVDGVDPRFGRWMLHWSYRLRNVSDRCVRLGSPATSGRSGAGYGGLFWRGAATFRDGPVSTEDASGEHAVNGASARSLTFTGETAALTFASADADPATWFVRSAEYPGACPALAFHDRLPLDPGGVLTGRYRFEITSRAAPGATAAGEYRDRES
ncbi:methane monooxygenase PmoA-like [Saccharopolyspora erythraea NRRL 2338]|uniref:Oxidoreductase domain protein n=2 Tax=Saccharopolyspora erythraea TaxID=1836 RepID=A4FJ66_SACEN|nr:PmoA family protein [Saccharopolyspora erythraea]EQD83564.1 oxidoreductase [Saccharopolyspora erythraea D]PFG97760.1 methane monooxygenase PmoA-like [Saccharopolyspora erythraea NRRL 2338]QRK87907.1 PmoA family protein [Saccharopolyspora erythraea]CAM04091.1 oxidoreductase domain protein [Saccharopolyspora erythraea NRRL 2338]